MKQDKNKKPKGGSLIGNNDFVVMYGCNPIPWQTLPPNDTFYYDNDYKSNDNSKIYVIVVDLHDEKLYKAISTCSDPKEAILDAIKQLIDNGSLPNDINLDDTLSLSSLLLHAHDAYSLLIDILIV